MANNLEIIVTVNRRHFWGRVIRFPKAVKQHYAEFRKSGLSVLASLYGSYLMAGLLLRTK
jgi:hypothetical protein